MRRLVPVLVFVALARPAAAQTRDVTAVGPVLSLPEAIDIATRNNPTHLQTRTARTRAGAALRSAYGSLLPNVQSSAGAGYREGRPQFFNGVEFGSTANVVSSSASLDVTAQYNMSNLIAPRVQRANLDAAEADIATSEANLRANVAIQYLNVLQAQARARLQDTLLTSAQAQLELARAREAVGAATTLDVRRAEVQVGQQQVALLRERNAVEIEKLRLFQQMGVPQPEGVRLTSDFPVNEPQVTLDELLAMARKQNPLLESYRARENAANLGMRQAQSAYTPTLSFRTGISGYTSSQSNIESQIARARASSVSQIASCFSQDSLRRGAGMPSIAGDCNKIPVFGDADAARFRAANDKYPFDLTRDPFNFSVGLSLPIFNGFQREQRVQEAAAARNDARYNVRAQELRLTADVTAAYRNLVTAYQAVRLQEQTSQTARQALALAQERFRVGANTFVDVVQARADFERAEADHINASYDFHKAYAALENSVGRSLR